MVAATVHAPAEIAHEIVSAVHESRVVGPAKTAGIQTSTVNAVSA